jgi:hypothetical protein
MSVIGSLSATPQTWTEWANEFLVSWWMMALLAVLYAGLLAGALWLRQRNAGSSSAPGPAMMTVIGLLGVLVVVELILRVHALSWIAYMLVLVTWVFVVWRYNDLPSTLVEEVHCLFSRKARAVRRERHADHEEQAERGQRLEASLDAARDDILGRPADE